MAEGAGVGGRSGGRGERWAGQAGQPGSRSGGGGGEMGAAVDSKRGAGRPMVTRDSPLFISESPPASSTEK